MPHYCDVERKIHFPITWKKSSGSAQPKNKRPYYPNSMEKSVVKDKGFAWIICFACFLVAAVGDGVGSSIGVLTPHIRKLMQSKSGSTALAESLHIAESLHQLLLL